MAKKVDKMANRIQEIFRKSNTVTRSQWERVNQKGFDFANDNQITEEERIALEEQGMPTFTINRITPVVEMLNFYATANNPRWQAVGAEGSDIDVAAVFSDMADYIWYNSDGPSIYANCINDAITKSLGYLLVTVDKNADRGMGEVIIQNPEPFDIFPDPKSRDIMFRDAGFVLIRKILPKSQVMDLFPEFKVKIKKANTNENNEYSYTHKSSGISRKDFGYKDISESESIDTETADHDKLIELYEMYEKVKIKYVNVFYRIMPSQEQLDQINQQVNVKVQEASEEMQVSMQEQLQEMQQAVQSGQMLQARYDLQIKKLQEEQQIQIDQLRQQMTSELVNQISKVENKVMTEKEYKILMDNELFVSQIINVIQFYDDRIKLCCVAGDTTLYEEYLPIGIKEYPIVPFHFKWTGTPFPMSAISPLIGKQRELNKAHQLLVHNASLGSSLRWMHEEGSIDTDLWEKYSSSPGALLPVRPGAAPPTPVTPAPLAGAFFQIVQEGKQDMEYLAGIYASAQGDTGKQHDTYRGMLAQDEYGTRRVKQWMKNSIEPSLKQLGTVVMQFSQSIYSANKTLRIVQPNAITEQKNTEINIPIYNDMGEAVGKMYDYQAAKFDVRVMAGSTLPMNRWAYLDELKQLMQLGVVDDIAVLAETDIRNKNNIIKRKSLYSQLQGQVQSLTDNMKEKDGAIETLERQLVQAGIKGKVQDAEMQIHKKKVETQAQISVKGKNMQNDMDAIKKEEQMELTKSKELGNAQGQRIMDHVASETDRMLQQEKHDLAMKKENVANNKNNK